MTIDPSTSSGQALPPNMQDYEAARREFRLDVPELYNFGFDVMDSWADDHTKLALVSVHPAGDTADKHTFYDLKVLSNKFANMLLGLGVEKGERAFIMAPRIPEWYVANLGMMKLGIVPMPATVLCTPHDIEYRVNRAEASVAIVDAENAYKVDEIIASCLHAEARYPDRRRTPGMDKLDSRERKSTLVARDRRTHPQRRPSGHILHIGHGGASQDGAPYPGVIRHRSRRHG